MKRYEHGGDIYTREVLYDFSANINPLGMPPSVRKAIVESVDSFARYPDPNCTALAAALSEYEQAACEQIICGSGAADLIYRIVYTLRPKRALLFAPTFCEYEKALRENGCSVTYCYLREEEDFAYTDRTAVELKEGIDICFLCSPNNPVGNILEPGLLGKILDKCQENNIFLVIDECFLSFVENGRAKSAVLRMNDRTIVLKAFTKIYAMAGLRLGYAICKNAELADKIRSCGQCWSVSVPAQAAGFAALADREYIKRTVETVQKEREYLMAECRALGLRAYPSKANFILFRLFGQGQGGAEAELSLDRLLLQDKIAIRSCENYEGLGSGFYRIAVRPHEENEALIQAMNRYLK